MRGFPLLIAGVLCGVCVTSCVVVAQPRLEFEVASVRPAPPPEGGRGGFQRMMGGPGTRDPNRFVADNAPLSGLIAHAYDLQRFQMNNPAWMDTARFNITAKVPDGTTKEQFLVMLQNLLVSRFGIKLHWEKKEIKTYELVVAKNGPKFKESPDAPANAPDVAPSGPPPPPAPPKMDKDGYPVFPAGRGTWMAIMNGKARLAAEKETMDEFIKRLGSILAAPITDSTGLKGKYEFTLSWAFDMAPMVGAGIGPPPPPPGSDGAGAPPRALDPDAPTLMAALPEQLGLKLESKKAPVSVLVIDSAEKSPTEN